MWYSLLLFVVSVFMYWRCIFLNYMIGSLNDSTNNSFAFTHWYSYQVVEGLQTTQVDFSISFWPWNNSLNFCCSQCKPCSTQVFWLAHSFFCEKVMVMVMLTLNCFHDINKSLFSWLQKIESFFSLVETNICEKANECNEFV